MSTFQQCPVCNGSGQVLAPGCTTSIYTTCSVCNGTRIISQITGQAPAIEVPGKGNFPVVNLQMLEKEFKEHARFIIGERIRDPQCTLDDIWAKWINHKNL